MRDHNDPHYSLGVSVLLDEIEGGLDSPAATPKQSEKRRGSKPVIDLDSTQQLDFDCTGSWSADTTNGKRPLPPPPPQARASASTTREPSTDEEADGRLLHAVAASQAARRSSAGGPSYLPTSQLLDESFTSEHMADLCAEMEDCMDYLQAVEEVTRQRGDHLRRELANQYGDAAVLNLEARLHAQQEAARRPPQGVYYRSEAEAMLAVAAGEEERLRAIAEEEQPSGVDESMLIFSEGFEPEEVELLVEGFAILRPS
eukprot:TRINITY_DN74220_c0_g1_i1.p1 TRINITY_DN74220_c0_g1~~TRINITY_DN74220_c0_g1_i1.p1  ORF type:complete len:258 (+),score=74.07 TRINITY_DN74220_c0_g1_i1:70-843(+)